VVGYLWHIDCFKYELDFKPVHNTKACNHKTEKPAIKKKNKK